MGFDRPVLTSGGPEQISGGSDRVILRGVPRTLCYLGVPSETVHSYVDSIESRIRISIADHRVIRPIMTDLVRGS